VKILGGSIIYIYIYIYKIVCIYIYIYKCRCSDWESEVTARGKGQEIAAHAASVSSVCLSWAFLSFSIPIFIFCIFHTILRDRHTKRIFYDSCGIDYSPWNQIVNL
jgi:amino acid transporter